MKINRISPRRQLIQFSLLVLLFLIPFLRSGDAPFLQLNIGLRTLFLFGTALRVDELFLLLLFTIVVMLLFFLITTLLGRIWCGWLCPQTVVNDLGDALSSWMAKPFAQPIARRLSEHLASALLSVLLSAALLGWFMLPAEVLQVFVHPGENLLPFSITVGTALFLYLDLVFVKREFCRSYCPYGRFQTVLLDEGTLNLAFRQEVQDRCINCRSCIRACPMGIDIRQGFQIECINCGRCIDACRDVMERRGAGDGLFAYRFGATAGNRPRLGQKTAILALALVIAVLTLAWNLNERSVSTFTLQRSSTAVVRQLPDGSYVQPWKSIIGNRGQATASFSLTVVSPPGAIVQLLGPVTDIRIAPNQNQAIDFYLKLSGPSGKSTPRLEFRLLKDGTQAATQTVAP